MLIHNLILIGLGVLAELAQAAEQSKGYDLWFMYTAYRQKGSVDVDASVANATSRGLTNSNLWLLADGCKPQPQDFGTGNNAQVPLGFRGCNFHGYMRWCAKPSYAYNSGMARIANPLSPTMAELFDVGTWPPVPTDPKLGKYSYDGVDINKAMGSIDLGNDRSFGNMLLAMTALTGLHLQYQPGVAKPRIAQMQDALRLAVWGRRKDQAGFIIDKWTQKIAEIGEASSNTVKTNQFTSAPQQFGTWPELDTVRSVEELGIAKYKADKIRALANDFVAKFKAGDFGADARTHEQTIEDTQDARLWLGRYYNEVRLFSDPELPGYPMCDSEIDDL